MKKITTLILALFPFFAFSQFAITGGVLEVSEKSNSDKIKDSGVLFQTEYTKRMKAGFNLGVIAQMESTEKIDFKLGLLVDLPLLNYVKRENIKARSYFRPSVFYWAERKSVGVYGTLVNELNIYNFLIRGGFSYSFFDTSLQGSELIKFITVGYVLRI